MSEHVNPGTPGQVIAAGMQWLGQQIKELIGLLSLLCLVGIGVVAYRAMTGPVCSVSHLRTQETIFPSNNGPDYGFTVSAEVKNTGKDGDLSVGFELITSQGVYNRRFTGRFRYDETKVVKAEFREPTVSVSDIRASAKCN